MSRYYDPVTGRFINADGMISTGEGFLAKNMFLCCENNPIMFRDPFGTCKTHGCYYMPTCYECNPSYKKFIDERGKDWAEPNSAYQQSKSLSFFEQYGQCGKYLDGDDEHKSNVIDGLTVNVGDHLDKFLSQEFCIKYVDNFMSLYGSNGLYGGMNAHRITVELYGHAWAASIYENNPKQIGNYDRAKTADICSYQDDIWKYYIVWEINCGYRNYEVMP